MFEMIQEHKRDPEDRKLALYKVGGFIVLAGIVAGIVYFLVTSGWH